MQEPYQELGESFRAALSTDTLASSNICFLLVEAVAGHMDFFIMIIFNLQKIKIICTDFPSVSRLLPKTKQNNGH